MVQVAIVGTGGGSVSFGIEDKSLLNMLSDALRAGMTPVISYWSAADMRWLDSEYVPDPYDGSGKDPCPWDVGADGYPRDDNQDTCGANIYFSDFMISEGRYNGSHTQAAAGGAN